MAGVTARHKTGGGPGTNQYRVRGTSGVRTTYLVNDLWHRGAMRQRRESVRAQEEAQQLLQRWSSNFHVWNPGPYGAAVIVLDPETPPADLVVISAYSDFRVWRSVARHINTPASVLSQLADHGSMWVDMAIAENPNATGEVLAKIATRGERVVLGAVATHRNTPAAVLAQLADNDDFRVKLAVAANPYTPPQTLDALIAKDHTPIQPSYDDHMGQGDDTDWVGPKIREVVAANPNIWPSSLIRLAARGESRVCERLAINPNTPNEALYRIVVSPNRDELEKRQRERRAMGGQSEVRRPEDGLVGMSTQSWFALGQHPNADRVTLEAMVTTDQTALQGGVATRLDCSADLFTRLARTGKPSVCEKVANNSAVSSGVLIAMLDMSDTARHYASHSPNMPAHIKAMLILGQ